MRIFKTRTMASQACEGGKVKVAGYNVKPSRSLKVGEEVQFTKQGQKFLYRVVELIDKRVGAPIAQTCYEDMTPEQWKVMNRTVTGWDTPRRDKGDGRPTKKDRRDIDKFRGMP